MYLNAKRMAFLGLFLAISVILVILSGILEFNTLFLLAAASFLVGVVIREYGLRLGIGFYIGSIALSLFLAPNKIYCITYSAMGFYIFSNEFTWIKFMKARKSEIVFWLIKYVIFNIIYIPIVFFMPRLLFNGEMNTVIYIILLVGGQVGLFIFDKAYTYFQTYVWTKFRKRFHMLFKP